MPTVTDNDLKELKDLITAGFSRIDAEITDLKINQARMEERLSGQIQALDAKLTGQINVVDEKITGLGKRLDFQEFLNRGFLIGFGVATLTGLAKLLGLLPKV
ncbi:MAG: hypothetical protein VKL42_05775 [Snowella sp.]|nr:hypothetical protein [Snowella sp.]